MEKEKELTVPKTDVYETVTNTIVNLIEAGKLDPWQLPWRNSIHIPINAVTKQSYNGVNIIQLWAETQLRSYNSHYFASFKQWQQLGAKVKKGEKGIQIVFYKSLVEEEESNSTKSEEADERKIWLVRVSYVFNSEQVEGWKPEVEKVLEPTEVNSKAESFINATGAKILFGGNSAYYNHVDDFIQMPKREQFLDSKSNSAMENFYSTLLHELVHYTGHQSRCNRELKNRFGDYDYAFEELIAEIGSAFLCADLSIKNCTESFNDSAKYLDSWLKVMKSDSKALFFAAARASEAVAYLKQKQSNSWNSGVFNWFIFL